MTPRLRLAAGLPACILLLALVAVPRHPVQASEAPVTFGRQIAPILYANCTSCHHAGGSGPFALTTYADAKRWGGLMEQVTASRYMPPWLPEPGHGDFAGNRRLPDASIALIRQWVAAGMPEGDPAAAPHPPAYTTDWQLGPPDLVLEVSSDIHVPASGADLFENVILPVPLSHTAWVRAMEIKPGSPQVVHHANLLVDRTASLRREHPTDWQHGIPGMGVTLDSGESFDPDSHFLDWKPDSAALVEPPGMPWRLDPGNDLVLNMHLKPTGKPETVRARIGLYFAAQPATELPILLQLEHDAALDIPAGKPDFTVEDQLTLPVDVDVLAIYPHAHYLGKRLEGWAVLPDHIRKPLLLIGSWDINRQAIYRYAKPVFLPRGSVVHMRYTFDNSAANPHNPNSPPIRVTAGNRSVDEMGHLWLQVLPRTPATSTSTSRTDPRVSLLRAWMENRLRKDPTDPTALFNLASIDMTSNDFTAAAGLYRKALAARPEDVRTTTALASALNESGDWQQAQTQLRSAVAHDATYPDARFDLAVIDLHHGEYSQAEEQLRAFLATRPDDASAHTGLGSVLLATNRTADAEAEFKTAARLDPADFDAVYNLAAIEVGDGRLHDALAHLTTAAALRPSDVNSHRGLVAVYSSLGQLPEALREQKLVVSLSSSDPGDWNDLGVLHVRTGDPAAARADFNHALTLDPANQTARSNLALLGSVSRTSPSH